MVCHRGNLPDMMKKRPEGHGLQGVFGF